jgi:hypothetical protein
MAAKKKSAAKKAAAKKKAAKKTAKTGKSRPVAKKAAKKVVKKAAKVAKSRPASKASPAPKRPAVVKAAVRQAAASRPVVDAAAVMAIDERIALVRANLRELVEQAASSAGAANEELLSQRIAEQEERLRDLRKQREELSGSPA